MPPLTRLPFDGAGMAGAQTGHPLFDEMTFPGANFLPLEKCQEFRVRTGIGPAFILMDIHQRRQQGLGGFFAGFRIGRLMLNHGLTPCPRRDFPRVSDQLLAPSRTATA